MPFPRASGILLHPTSLPSRFGIGDLGPEAYHFIDFLAHTRQQLWQVLPLGPTGHGNSPYLCYSSMAGNPLLISLEVLCDRSLLYPDELHDLEHFSPHQVDFDQVIPIKMRLLERAASRFHETASDEDKDALVQFSEECHFWVDEFAFFMALKNAHGGAGWTEWPSAIARREPEAMAEWREKLSSDIFCQKFLQFEFHRQWQSLRQYARDRQIQIIGDIPIYVAHDSADVWAFPHNFMLDHDTLAPALMAGVPPDYFSETGQLWGNPTYNWEELKNRDFHWWIQRINALLGYVDIIRVDHFRGLQAYWGVPAGEDTAMNGQWIEAPGTELFETVRQKFGTLPIMAEDLGVITPEVEALRDEFEFPGMKILHFAFGGGSDNPYLPFNYVPNSVVYTGTHDNDTTIGWFDKMPDHERNRLMEYLGCLSPEGIHWTMIRLALMSVANQAIVPLQDILGYGSDCRMNTPGKSDGNWGWRYQAEALTDEMRDRLRWLTELSNRTPTEG
ncbi:4-alpha-glucanotransferase [Nodosilinea sp. LEGE 07298]|uniref:4-alpha-glucanotransferase n=1 Tax=Nodosilinea sp. LEGE 07298 TaxID=2777970 RepID=UPI00187EB50D|nr:4-alpha-glucanotransferase [Nodosilinea sp. LEGE 07298]MBE9113406.1 4-alpha-glucanotransferase [Nodosilinea sp. LEGE 07298]